MNAHSGSPNLYHNCAGLVVYCKFPVQCLQLKIELERKLSCNWPMFNFLSTSIQFNTIGLTTLNYVPCKFAAFTTVSQSIDPWMATFKLKYQLQPMHAYVMASFRYIATYHLGMQCASSIAIQTKLAWYISLSSTSLHWLLASNDSGLIKTNWCRPSLTPLTVSMSYHSSAMNSADIPTVVNFSHWSIIKATNGVKCI